MTEEQDNSIPQSAFEPDNPFHGGTDNGGAQSGPIAPDEPTAVDLLFSHILPHPDALADLTHHHIISHACAARLCLLYYIKDATRRGSVCQVSVRRISERLRLPIRTVGEALETWAQITRTGVNGSRNRPWLFTPWTPTGNPPPTPTGNPPPHKVHKRSTHVAPISGTTLSTPKRHHRNTPLQALHEATAATLTVLNSPNPGAIIGNTPSAPQGAPTTA